MGVAGKSKKECAVECEVREKTIEGVESRTLPDSRTCQRVPRDGVQPQTNCGIEHYGGKCAALVKMFHVVILGMSSDWKLFFTVLRW